jgi:titin
LADGGAPILDYKLTYDQATDTWIELDPAVTETRFTATGLTQGSSYSFKVEARNTYGYSDASASVTILCATIPDTPATPSSANSLDQVIFDWVAPDDNGLPITSYTVMIRQADNQYSEILEYCNGALAEVVAATECTVPLSTLTSPPFDLILNDSIDFVVRATNAYGDSEFSQVGGGALIQLVPDAPLNLQDKADETSATQITFTWEDGASDGGAAVLDYRIYYDQATDTWIELDSSITAQVYTTQIVLTEGHTYSFKVQARNSVGYG